MKTILKEVLNKGGANSVAADIGAGCVLFGFKFYTKSLRKAPPPRHEAKEKCSAESNYS